MIRAPLRWMPWLLAFALAGCSFPVREQVDSMICDMAARPMDLTALPPTPGATGTVDGSADRVDENVQQASVQEPVKDKPISRPLQIPLELPGVEPEPELPKEPKAREKALEEIRKKREKELAVPLPPLGEMAKPEPGPNGKPLSLSDLQALAQSNSPVLRAATADVQAARGAAIQAGAYPNPNFGYEGDTIGTGSGTPGAGGGYQGGFVEQIIKTAGKLKLAQAAAVMDLFNAELALRRAQSDLASQVRAGYFAVLVARENARVALALARFSDAVYQVQIVKGKPAIISAGYEPFAARVLAFQARAFLLQARNHYTATWKQLAATLGLPGMPPTELAGRVDMPIPIFEYEKALARLLSTHTDVLTARNTLQKARYNLRFAQVTPIPDVDLRVMVQKDFTTPPFLVTPSLQVSVPIPVWDRNSGNIMQAQGQLMRAIEEDHRVRDDLTSRLAEAFERYQNNRAILEYYRTRLLPDQVRAFRGIYDRYHQELDKVSFNDVITSQQTLATLVQNYVATLGAMWTAVVDVANLLQTNDLFQVGLEPPPTQPVAPVPDLEHLWSLPCGHPCSPLPDGGLRGADGSWPVPFPKEAEKPALTPSPENDSANQSIPTQEAPAIEQTSANVPAINALDSRRGIIPLRRQRALQAMPAAPDERKSEMTNPPDVLGLPR